MPHMVYRLSVPLQTILSAVEGTFPSTDLLNKRKRRRRNVWPIDTIQWQQAA